MTLTDVLDWRTRLCTCKVPYYIKTKLQSWFSIYITVAYLKKMTPLIGYYPVCITSWDHPFFFETSHSVLFVYVSRHAWQKEFFSFSFQILSTHPDDPSKARVNSPLLVTYHLREWDLLCFSTDSCLTWQCCNKWALTKCI